jgi:hypothetical protein
MFGWNVAVRSRIGDLALVASSHRESFVATDAVLAFEDRAEITAAFDGRVAATAFAARTRIWRGLERSDADSIGGELALAVRVAGFDVITRVAAGRSFYASMDATPDQTAFGVRATIDLQRTFEIHRAGPNTASNASWLTPFSPLRP